MLPNSDLHFVSVRGGHFCGFSRFWKTYRIIEKKVFQLRQSKFLIIRIFDFFFSLKILKWSSLNSMSLIRLYHWYNRRPGRFKNQEEGDNDDCMGNATSCLVFLSNKNLYSFKLVVQVYLRPNSILIFRVE